MLTAWLLIAPAAACEWADTDDDDKCERPLAIKADEPPPPPRAVLRPAPPPPPPAAPAPAQPAARAPAPEQADDGELELRYGMQFLAEAPAHHGYARLIGRKDAYVGAEMRYLPASDLLWTARLGAGFDVFGKSPVDLTLGLWIGGAGTWDVESSRAVLYNTPVAGTEIAVGAKIGRMFGKYRWIGGFGTSPLKGLLTENELTIGVSLVDEIQLYGQWVVLDADTFANRGALGLGVQATL